jgi:N-acetyl-alpha-D-muramate 1-phosphate uridylyltransferase
MMKVMILAAGRGERMRPLTDVTPKPLLPVGGKTIIEHTLIQLVSSGFKEIIINHAHLGQQIEDYLGDGQRYGATIQYSPEGEQGLETAGGIINALPLLGNEVFMVVNGDIATNFPFEILLNQSVDLAHIVLVNNPLHHEHGDFGLEPNGRVTLNSVEKFTFSGIGLYHPDLFKDIPFGSSKLGSLLRQAMSEQRVSGQKFSGFWMDIGTPERLETLNRLDGWCQ